MTYLGENVVHFSAISSKITKEMHDVTGSVFIMLNIGVTQTV